MNTLWLATLTAFVIIAASVIVMQDAEVRRLKTELAHSVTITTPDGQGRSLNLHITDAACGGMVMIRVIPRSN